MKQIQRFKILARLQNGKLRPECFKWSKQKILGYHHYSTDNVATDNIRKSNAIIWKVAKEYNYINGYGYSLKYDDQTPATINGEQATDLLMREYERQNKICNDALKVCAGLLGVSLSAIVTITFLTYGDLFLFPILGEPFYIMAAKTILWFPISCGLVGGYMGIAWNLGGKLGLKYDKNRIQMAKKLINDIHNQIIVR